jgi:hypothetical protein
LDLIDKVRSEELGMYCATAFEHEALDVVIRAGFEHCEQVDLLIWPWTSAR